MSHLHETVGPNPNPGRYRLARLGSAAPVNTCPGGIALASWRQGAGSATRWLAVAATLILLSLAGSATALGKGTGASIAPPASIKAAGQIVFCSDITYPPEEFYRGTTPVGSDIAIGQAVAKLMGVKAVFANTGFDGIIAALLSQKCDAIISGMGDTPAREKVITFVDYILVGQSLMMN
jgi:polar amino acid transport system substrate-binding protein